MNRFVAVAFVALVGSSCLTVDNAREQAAQRQCRFAQRCGNIGPGQTFATLQECLTDARADWLNTWPTDRCDGRINGDALNVCLVAIDNTQCNNFFDLVNTLSKCQSSDVCSAGSPGGCNCGQGQTCCNNQCVNLQTDRNNCGACGTTCGSSVSCQSGVCR